MFSLLIIAGILSTAFCGTIDDPQPQIINGAIAQPRQFPFAASIRRAGALGHMGGGTLISDRWVLTAATVMIQFARPQDAAVALGHLNFAATVVAPGLVSTASDIRYFPTFNNNGPVPVDNIAMVLIPAVACNAARFGIISPVYLEPRLQTGTVTGTTAGWGPISENKDPNTLLRFATTTFSATCTNVTASTICMDSILCTTDVGSGLMTASGLIGVASATSCGATGTFDIYSRISSYHSWITSNAGI